MLAALLAGLLPVLAFAAGPRAVTTPGDLMIEAIDAPEGTAHGILTGEMARAISEGFGTTAPLRIDVSTLKTYEEEGCRRLNVRFSQEDVRSPAGSMPRARHVDFGIDYCRSGRPPSTLRAK